MKTYEFISDSSDRDVGGYHFYRLTGDPRVCFCRDALPFKIPTTAKIVWVEVRDTPAKGYVKAQFVKEDEVYWDLRIGNKIHKTTWGLGDFARKSKHFKLSTPFYFCMYYE